MYSLLASSIYVYFVCMMTTETAALNPQPSREERRGEARGVTALEATLSYTIMDTLE